MTAIRARPYSQGVTAHRWEVFATAASAVGPYAVEVGSDAGRPALRMVRLPSERVAWVMRLDTQEQVVAAAEAAIEQMEAA